MKSKNPSFKEVIQAMIKHKTYKISPRILCEIAKDGDTISLLFFVMMTLSMSMGTIGGFIKGDFWVVVCSTPITLYFWFCFIGGYFLLRKKELQE